MCLWWGQAECRKLDWKEVFYVPLHFHQDTIITSGHWTHLSWDQSNRERTVALYKAHAFACKTAHMIMVMISVAWHIRSHQGTCRILKHDIKISEKRTVHCNKSKTASPILFICQRDLDSSGHLFLCKPAKLTAMPAWENTHFQVWFEYKQCLQMASFKGACCQSPSADQWCQWAVLAKKQSGHAWSSPMFHCSFILYDIWCTASGCGLKKMGQTRNPTMPA